MNSLSFRGKSTSLLTVSLLAVMLLGCEPTVEQNEAPSFKEPYRSQFHYTPQQNWMNDPNGLVYYNGTYHLFHQFNPEGNTWGHMSWAHATSEDLVDWTHQPLAIPEEGNEMIFSGSAVVDHANTSGFAEEGNTPLVAIYTSHYALDDPGEKTGKEYEEAQSLAYSTDDGKTWTKYEGNPVLDHADPDFRDPNVFWYEPGEHWIMAVTLSTQRKVQFYRSDDLKNWRHLSNFGPAGSSEGIWECPALLQVPVENHADSSRWVLEVDVGDHSVAGGSGGQYFVGTFDGTSFVPDDGTADSPRWVDYGTDFYAAIPWNNVPESDGRRLWIAWMNNWTYANEIPTSPWRSAQTLPRSIHLRPVAGNRLQLVQRPIDELQQLREDHVQIESQSLDAGTVSLSEEGVSGKALELVAEFAPDEAETVGLSVRGGDDEKTVIGYDARSEVVFVDRTESGTVDFNAEFADRNEAPLELKDGRIKLHVYVDWSSVEVFANDGARVLTQRIFPDPKNDEVSLFSQGGTARLARLDAWSLRSIW